jgi:hypothetical protein
MVAAVIAVYVFRFCPTGRICGFGVTDTLLQFGIVFLFVYFFVLFIAGRLQPKKKH